MQWRLTTAAADSGFAARERGREKQSLVRVSCGGIAFAAAEPTVSPLAHNQYYLPILSPFLREMLEKRIVFKMRSLNFRR